MSHIATIQGNITLGEAEKMVDIDSIMSGNQESQKQ